MLKALRKKETAKKIFWLLALVVIPPFILWGSGSLLRSREDAGYAGKIFGRRISWDAYQDAYLACRNKALLQFGENFPRIAKYLDLKQQTWNRLILLSEAHERKFKVEDQEVIELIKKMPFFQEAGQFSPQLYNTTLEYLLRTQARAFEEQLREDLTIEKLYQTVTKDITVNGEEVFAEYQKIREVIKAECIIAGSQDFIPQVRINGKEVVDYFHKNQHLFRVPPTVKVAYLPLPHTTAKMALEQTQLNLINNYLKKGWSLQAIGKELNVPCKETGFFSLEEPVAELGYIPAFNEAAFNPKDEKKVQLVETLDADFLIQILSRQSAYLPDFKKAKVKVLQKLRDEKSKQIAKEVLQRLASQIETSKKTKKTINLKRLAQKAGLMWREWGALRRGEHLPGIGATDLLYETALKLKNSQISPPLEIEQGWCLVRKIKFYPVDNAKFLKDKEGFSKNLLEKKKVSSFQKHLEDLIKKANLVSFVR